VLCAYGDATTSVREERSRTWVRRFGDADPAEFARSLDELARAATAALDEEGVPRAMQRTSFEVDVRYHGQGLLLPVPAGPEDGADLFAALGARFDALHEQLFAFTLDVEHEFVNLRAVVAGLPPRVAAGRLPPGDTDAQPAAIGTQRVRIDGGEHAACVYERARLRAGNRVPGPAIVVQMDTTTLILPGHVGVVDDFGNLLIRPEA